MVQPCAPQVVLRRLNAWDSRVMPEPRDARIVCPFRRDGEVVTRIPQRCSVGAILETCRAASASAVALVGGDVTTSVMKSMSNETAIRKIPGPTVHFAGSPVPGSEPVCRGLQFVGIH